MTTTDCNILSLKNIDVRTVDHATLVDIEKIRIDPNLPQHERMIQFIQQVKNPYCFKVGDVVVKTTYVDSTTTLEERMKHYFATKSI